MLHQRSRTHVAKELLLYQATVPKSHRKRHRGAGGGADGGGGEKAKAQVSVPSVGEERALLLGFSMMILSILMYFVVGIVVIRPCIDSAWGDSTNCSVIQTEILNKSEEQGSRYPCLRVLVKSTDGKLLHLRFDEAAVNLSPECFYTPKKHQNKCDMMHEAQRIKEHFQQGQIITCHLNDRQCPEDAILTKRYNLHIALQHLVWPSLMLFGGALLTGLVIFTQYLAQLCKALSQEEGLEDGQSTAQHSKLYRFLSYRPWSSSIDN